MCFAVRRWKWKKSKTQATKGIVTSAVDICPEIVMKTENNCKPNQLWTIKFCKTATLYQISQYFCSVKRTEKLHNGYLSKINTGVAAGEIDHVTCIAKQALQCST